jgi:hypothetical protein
MVADARRAAPLAAPHPPLSGVFPRIVASRLTAHASDPAIRAPVAALAAINRTEGVHPGDKRGHRRQLSIAERNRSRDTAQIGRNSSGVDNRCGAADHGVCPRLSIPTGVTGNQSGCSVDICRDTIRCT